MTADRPAGKVPLDALLAHRDWVRALARRLVADENDADDVEQETWRMAVERPPRHAESLRSWLATVVRNAARMSGRRRSRRASHEAEAAFRRDVPSPADLVAAAELQTRLARAVLELDEPYRSTVLYRFREGLETLEIAARLGVPLETVRTRLKRAVAQLRERMETFLGDDRDAWCLLLFGMRAAEARRLAPVGTGAAAALGGGVVMAVGTKLAVGVMLAAVGAWWLWPKSDDAAPHANGETPPAVSIDTATAPPKREPRTRAVVDDVAPPAETKSVAPPEVPFGPDDVHGRVIDDETGRAVKDVSVALVWESMPRTGREPSAVTGEDGAFRIGGVQEGTFGNLLLRADEYAECLVELPWRDAAAKLAKFDAGDVRIFRGRRIAGRVLAADGRTPVADATLRIGPAGGSTSGMWISRTVACGKCGDGGAFVLERVPPSPHLPYILFAVAPGGVGWSNLPATGGRADLDGIEVTLRAAASATVTVIDESGAPQPGACVIASPRFEPLGPPRHWNADHDFWLAEGTDIDAAFAAKTDASGVARFTRLPTGDEGASYDFIARGKGAAWKDGVRVTPGEETTISIALTKPKTWSIAGLVHRSDGAPVGGATVTSPWSNQETTTAADGRFRFDGIAADWEKLGLVVKAQGCADAEQVVRAERGKDLAETEILVEPAAPIEGRIVDQDGRPVAGCYVDLLREGGGQPSQTTGDDGRFSFPGTTSGTWTLRHNPPPPYDLWRSEEHQSLVHGGDREIVVVLHRLAQGKARLVVTIVDGESGALLSADEAMLLPETRGDEPIRSADARKDIGVGTVTFDRMRPGRYRVWVNVPGRGAFAAGVEVVDSQTEVTARVVVGRPGKLRGRLDPPATGPTGIRWVSITQPGDWTSPSWAGYRTKSAIGGETVTADGTFTFESIAAGRYRLWTEQDGWLGEGFADVPSGGEATVVVTFVRGGVVSFRLTGPSPSQSVQWDVAEGTGPWRCVMRMGGIKGQAYREDATLRPGRYRWRVTFPADSFVSARTAAETQEGELVVVAGETVVVDVPVVAR